MSATDGNGKPVQNGGTTTSNSIRFSFTGPDNTGAVSNFQCSMDSRPYSTCGSGASYSGLTVGGHTLSVVSVDSSGNVDASAATFTWIVVEPQQEEASGSGSNLGLSLPLTSSQEPQQTESVVRAPKPEGQAQSSDSSALTATAGSSYTITVNPGETVTHSWICPGSPFGLPGDRFICLQTSSPAGSFFTSTEGNPAEGTFIWPDAGPPGTYTETVITHFTFCAPSNPPRTCLDSEPSTLTIIVNQPPEEECPGTQVRNPIGFCESPHKPSRQVNAPCGHPGVLCPVLTQDQWETLHNAALKGLIPKGPFPYGLIMSLINLGPGEISPDQDCTYTPSKPPGLHCPAKPGSTTP